MQVGEVMSMKACLCALIIRSANEVAAQIAEHVGGTEQNFIDMMNQRAAEIDARIHILQMQAVFRIQIIILQHTIWH